MTKIVKSVIHEPRCGWYLILFTDGTFKEKYMSRPYKYVEKFMAEHDPEQIAFGRYAYYVKDDA